MSTQYRLIELKTVRPIAFYLPQYHSIPENDEWWGKGFTEWRNVAKAKPLFPGHDQPRVPADLGFYDLRLPETRQAQADLAREYGIFGFCYYHYWFNGRRLLQRPFNEVLATGQPNMPFCLCWANENWSRTWTGSDQEVLIAQKYSDEDDRQHIRSLITAFRDERYIKVKGKPLFLVYRAAKLPNPMRTTSIWREEARRAGIDELYLCRVESTREEKGEPALLGFDAAVEFQPAWGSFGAALQRGAFWQWARRFGLTSGAYGTHRVFEYEALVTQSLRQHPAPYKRFPSVTPGWDNSARRQTRATIFKNSTPALYEKWLRGVIETYQPSSPEENFIFINAWNEWAEGNHLEPCQKWGRAYLEATRKAVALEQMNAPQPMGTEFAVT